MNEWVNDALLGVLDFVRSVDPTARTLLTGMGMFLETTLLVGLILPGDSIVLVASTGVESPAEYVALLLAVILGALSGESVGFALGRFFGRRIRVSRLGSWIGEPNWQRAANYVDRRGGIAVFVSRFLPVLHSVVPVTVGMSTMSYRRFMTWTAPACVVWALAYVTFGSAAAVSYRQISDTLQSAGYLFVGVIVLFLIGVFVAKRLLERSQARHMAHPGDGDPTTIEDPVEPPQADGPQ